MIRSLFSRVVLASLILLPVVIQGQIVSFRAEAQSVPKLIQAINSQFKTSYAASKAMTGDIVCVQVTDVDLGELLEKIAEVTAAAWVRRGGVLTLEPSTQLRRAEEKTETDYKTTSYERQLANYVRSWERQGIDPKLADQLPLVKIAEQPAWNVEVFAVSPTRQQERINNRIPNMMGTQWMQNRRANNNNREIQVGSYEDFHIVSRQRATNVTIALEATDAKGAVIASTSISLRNSTSYPRVTVPDTIDANKVITVSPLQRAFAKLWSVTPEERNSDTPLYVVKSLVIDQSLRTGIEKIIGDPVNNEPLSIFVSPVLNTAARIEGRDLVALLPDAAIGLANYVDQAPTMESETALRFLRGSVVQSRNSGQWTLMTPVLPKQSRVDRIDRETLQALVRDVATTGALDPVALTDVLPGSAMSRTDMTDGFIGYYDVGVAGSARAAFSSQFSTYNALSKVPRQYLKQALGGSSVTIERMTGTPMKAATRDIFDRRLPVSQTTQGIPIINGSTSVIALQVQRGRSGRGQTRVSSSSRLSPPIEVTDLLPSGVTALDMEITVRSNRMIQGRSLSRGFVQRATLDQMANAAANAEAGRTSQRTDGLLVSEEYMAVERKYWSITYRLPNGMFASTNVSWLEPDFRSGWKQFTSLDQNFLQQYERSLNSARERVARGESRTNRRGGGRRIPPPQ